MSDDVFKPIFRPLMQYVYTISRACNTGSKFKNRYFDTDFWIIEYSLLQIVINYATVPFLKPYPGPNKRTLVS